MKSFEAYDEIYAVVSAIPKGKVATYGQVAELAGLPRRARMVGYALRELPPGSELPWHRVVNRKQEISPRKAMGHLVQRDLLEREGVIIDERGKIDFARFLWMP